MSSQSQIMLFNHRHLREIMGCRRKTRPTAIRFKTPLSSLISKRHCQIEQERQAVSGQTSQPEQGQEVVNAAANAPCSGGTGLWLRAQEPQQGEDDASERTYRSPVRRGQARRGLALVPAKSPQVAPDLRAEPPAARRRTGSRAGSRAGPGRRAPSAPWAGSGPGSDAVGPGGSSRPRRFIG